MSNLCPKQEPKRVRLCAVKNVLERCTNSPGQSSLARHVTLLPRSACLLSWWLAENLILAVCWVCQKEKERFQIFEAFWSRVCVVVSLSEFYLCYLFRVIFCAFYIRHRALKLVIILLLKNKKHYVWLCVVWYLFLTVYKHYYSMSHV